MAGGYSLLTFRIPKLIGLQHQLSNLNSRIVTLVGFITISSYLLDNYNIPQNTKKVNGIKLNIHNYTHKCKKLFFFKINTIKSTKIIYIKT